MSQRPCRILVVDDSLTFALKLRLLLEGEGWEATTASSAEEAMEVLNRSVPDLLVVDYMLPGMRGDELCRRVRMNMKTRGLPILMLTMREGQEAELRGLESGADEYVSKASDLDLLTVRVRSLLRRAGPFAGELEGFEVQLRRSRILAVDDSPTYLGFLTAQLQEEGYVVDTADGALPALRKLQSETYDCLVVDLMMPEVDGIELCRRVDRMRPEFSKPLTVLMLTSRESKEDLTRALESGADDFVGKSNDVAVLKGRIRALLRRKLYQEENQRILEELKHKELEAMRARARGEAAEARAQAAEQVARAYGELEQANRLLQETQAHLVHSEKMASLGRLVAGVAHEVNNPLSYVLNTLFNVERWLAALAPEVEPHLSAEGRQSWERARSRLDSMRDGLERVRDLVLKLRTFSRLDEGDVKTVDVPESVESVLTILHSRLEDRIRVERRYSAERLLTCFAGPLNQLLMNLISNAIDAIPGEGAITIGTGVEGDRYRISVADTGVGIPADLAGRIFEPFYTTKPVGSGTGLGLAITYGIVQSHFGTIDVRSVPGKGAEFVVRLPLDLERRLREKALQVRGDQGG